MKPTYMFKPDEPHSSSHSQARPLHKVLGFKFPPPSGFYLDKACMAIEQKDWGPMVQARYRKFERLVEELGGREEVVKNLEFVDEPTAQLLVSAFSHPEYEDKPAVFFFVGAKVNEAGARTLIAHGLKRRSAYEAARATAPKVFSVVNDLAEDSVGKYITCPSCGGDKTDEDGRVCDTCHGEGTVKLKADVKTRELFLKQAGLIQEGGGVSLTVNQTMQMAAASLPSLEDVVRSKNTVTVEPIEATHQHNET